MANLKSYEQILGLDVTVNDVLFMAVDQGAGKRSDVLHNHIRDIIHPNIQIHESKVKLKRDIMTARYFVTPVRRGCSYSGCSFFVEDLAPLKLFVEFSLGSILQDQVHPCL